MSRHWLSLICGIALFAATGCNVKSSMKYTSQYADNIGKANVIFNPDYVQLPPQFVGRADWPSTSAYQATGETVEYRETITDQGSRNFGHGNTYQRRFYSTRTGRQIR